MLVDIRDDLIDKLEIVAARNNKTVEELIAEKLEAISEMAGIPILINEINFPDPEILKIAESMDIAGKGYLLESDRLKELRINNKYIKSMMGVDLLSSIVTLANCDVSEDFTLVGSKLNEILISDCSGLKNMLIMDCPNMKAIGIELNNKGVIDKVTIKNCKSLQFIEARDNVIHELEIFNCAANGVLEVYWTESRTKFLRIIDCKELKRLDCNDNDIEELDTSQLINLQYLNVDNNRLKSLDLSSNYNLTFLTCRQNLLQEINVSMLKNLEALCCSKNPIHDINVSYMKFLADLEVNFTNIQCLELLNLPEIYRVFCENTHIEQAYIINCPKLRSLYFSNNYHLSEISIYNAPELDFKSKSDDIQISKVESQYKVKIRRLGKADYMAYANGRETYDQNPLDFK